MKKLLLGALLAAVFLIVVAEATGLNLRYIQKTPDMLVNFTARVGCSLHYVVKLEKEQVRKDLAVYSPLFRLPELTFSAAEQKVESHFLGEYAVAFYEPGFGCTLGQVPQEAREPRLYTGRMPVEVTRLQLLDRELERLLEQDNQAGLDTRALLVMNRQGEVVGEAYAEGFDKDSVFLGWSMSKTLVSTIIGSMQYRGVIPSEPALPLFDAWQDQRKSIRLNNLLNMTSGMVFDEVYQPGTDATQMLFGDASASERALTKKSVFKAGQDWEYSSGSTNLLVRYAIQRFGNNPEQFRRFVDEYVLYPLGMAKAVLEEDQNGHFIGSSFTYATAQGWANLGLVFLNEGEINGYRLFDKAYAKAAVSPNNSQDESRYGYQLWLNQGVNNAPLKWPSLPKSVYAIQGNREQFVMILPDQGIIVVRLGWSEGEYPKASLVERILKNYSPEI